MKEFQYLASAYLFWPAVGISLCPAILITLPAEHAEREHTIHLLTLISLSDLFKFVHFPYLGPLIIIIVILS